MSLWLMFIERRTPTWNLEWKEGWQWFLQNDCKEESNWVWHTVCTC